MINFRLKIIAAIISVFLFVNKSIIYANPEQNDDTDLILGDITVIIKVVPTDTNLLRILEEKEINVYLIGDGEDARRPRKPEQKVFYKSKVDSILARFEQVPLDKSYTLKVIMGKYYKQISKRLSEWDVKHKRRFTVTLQPLVCDLIVQSSDKDIEFNVYLIKDNTQRKFLLEISEQGVVKFKFWKKRSLRLELEKEDSGIGGQIRFTPLSVARKKKDYFRIKQLGRVVVTAVCF
ncbi:MAG: hypothetical protein ACFFDN_48915 [Candidatus Hodarchaeota archaeon]